MTRFTGGALPPSRAEGVSAKVTPMDRDHLYDVDVYAWSERQAATLRGLIGTRRDLPNELDLENVAEEIEELGSNRRDAAESYIRLILVHLIKMTAAPQASALKHWRAEIVTFHIELTSKLTPAMMGRIDLDRLWRLAKRQARAALEEENALDETALIWDVERCPISLDAFVRDEFLLDEALTKLPR